MRVGSTSPRIRSVNWKLARTRGTAKSCSPPGRIHLNVMELEASRHSAVTKVQDDGRDLDLGRLTGGIGAFHQKLCPTPEAPPVLATIADRARLPKQSATTTTASIARAASVQTRVHAAPTNPANRLDDVRLRLLNAIPVLPCLPRPLWSCAALSAPAPRLSSRLDRGHASPTVN